MIEVSQYRAAVGRWHLFCISRPKQVKNGAKQTISLNIWLQEILKWSKLLTFIICLLLILSGDIHQNPGPQSLQICHANVRSLCPSQPEKKIDEIYHVLCQQECCDIVCISETWLNKNITDDQIAVQGYQVYRKDRMSNFGRAGGGVAIYCQENLPVTRRSDLELDELELVLIEIKTQHKRVIIGCCYRPPEATAAQVKSFIENVQMVLNMIYIDSP